MATRSAFRPAVRSLPRHATRASRVQGVRAYASSSSAGGGSSKWPLYGALGLGAAGLGYYFVTAGDLSDKEKRYTQVKDANKALDYQEVYKDVVKVLEEESYDDGSYGPVLVRLAWHASGTYDKNSNNGGSNGATMRFAPESDHGANAGLGHARDRLEPIYQKYAKQGLTYSDLWTLAGVVAVQELGGPKIPWRPGRQDGFAENCSPDGRLPDGDKGQDHLRWVFYKMGFNDQEIVALSGAHALGRCHTDRSGFDGPWTHSPISFTNEYYKLLYNDRWKPRKWNGPPQFYNESSEAKKGQDASPPLMMLSTDISLIKDKEFKKWSRKYADDEELFFSDFSKAYAKLIELGVPEANWGGKEPSILKASYEYE